MRFTIQRILGIPPVIALGLLLLTPVMGHAQARPDLKVTSMTGVPATAVPGDSFVVTTNVLNQSTAAAGTSITKFELISTTPGGLKKNLKGVQNIPGLAGAPGPGNSANPPVTLAVYSDTAPGQYLVRACANSVTPKILETTTANNCLEGGTITVFDVPDLVMTQMFEPPPSFKVPQGQSFHASYKVKNAGLVSAPQFLVRFSLLFGTTRISLKTAVPETVGPLAPGAPHTNDDLIVTVRSETAPGIYLLEGCADSGKTVPEHNEADNCKTSLATVEVTPQPDLLVKEVTVTGAPLSVDQGEPLAIKVVVKNKGLRDAEASTLKFVLVSTGATPLSKNLKGVVNVDPVPKNTEVTINATPKVYDDTVLGTYAMQACVDSEKVVGEILESNNCGTAPGTVTVTGVPLSPADLAVTALLMPPPPRTFVPGLGFALTATVNNHGTGPSPITTTTRFYLLNAANLKTSLKGAQFVDPLAVGVPSAIPATVQVYPGTATGSYRVQACADGKKELHENNEDDNCFTSTDSITVAPAPDLVVTQVNNPPLTIDPGQTFPLAQTKVQNVGAVNAPASVVRFFLVSTPVATLRIDMDGSVNVPALGSNAPPYTDLETTVKVRSETPPGAYKLQACADGGKDILESDEDDNCTLSAGTVQVGAVPDLVISSVKLPPPPVTVARGATVTLNAVVKNQGFAAAPASSLRFSLVVAAGAAPIKKLPEIVSVLGVAVGDKQPTTSPVTIPTSTPVGTYFVQACVDTAKVVLEISESNNCATSTEIIEVQ